MTVNVIGWTITTLLILGALLRHLTVYLNSVCFIPIAHFPTGLRWHCRDLLVGLATVIAGIGVGGSIWFPLPGLWGPAVLVFAVLWSVNARWLVRHMTWNAPVSYGLEYGEFIVLLGGSMGTLIAYLLVSVV